VTDDALSADPTADELADYLRGLALRLEDAVERLERLAQKDRRSDHDHGRTQRS
jgi:hypothetical protein